MTVDRPDPEPRPAERPAAAPSVPFARSVATARPAPALGAV
ncbi:MAG: hypothetical protein ACJ77V_13555 [Chloroflexota bacterium]